MTFRDFDPNDSTYLEHLRAIALDDAEGLTKAQKSYGNSWKQRGGVGAFMMLARKWDRLENRVATSKMPLNPVDASDSANPEHVMSFGVDKYDIFEHVLADPRSEGVIDDIRDLRRYLLLVEAELVARGLQATHRDNEQLEENKEWQ